MESGWVESHGNHKGEPGWTFDQEGAEHEVYPLFCEMCQLVPDDRVGRLEWRETARSVTFPIFHPLPPSFVASRIWFSLPPPSFLAQQRIDLEIKNLILFPVHASSLWHSRSGASPFLDLRIK